MLLKVLWVFITPVLALFLGRFLPKDLNLPLYSPVYRWSLLFFVVPGIVWIACFLKNRQRTCLILSVTTIGALITGPATVHISKAIWVDHHFLNFSFTDGTIYGQILGIVSLAFVAEGIRYATLHHCLQHKDADSPWGIPFICISVCIGTAIGIFLVTLDLNSTPILTAGVLSEYAAIFCKQITLACIWVATLRQQVSTRVLSKYKIINDMLCIFFVALAHITISLALQKSSSLGFVIVFFSLAGVLLAVLYAKISDPKPEFRSFTKSSLSLYLTFTVFSLLAYRVVASPHLSQFSQLGLQFEYPSHWKNLQPIENQKESIGDNPFQLKQSSSHFEIVSIADPSARIEIRIADKYEGSMLRSSLHMQRVAQYGDHQWILQESQYDHHGKDWRKTHFTYPYHLALGSPPIILHGIEFAIVEGDHLYVVTLHSKPHEIQSLNKLVAPTLNASPIE